MLSDAFLEEGDTFSFSLDFHDPGFTNVTAGTEETFSATVDWGDESPLEDATVTVTQGSEGVLTVGTVSRSHLYPQHGFYTVIVRLQDDDLGDASESHPYIVANVAPEVQPLSAVSGNEGSEVDVHAEFSDAGVLDTHDWTIDWGDGSSEAFGSPWK